MPRNTDTDGRSRTSRANLEPYIPKPLSPDGNSPVTVRLSTSVIKRIERAAKAAKMTRSDWLRATITDALD